MCTVLLPPGDNPIAVNKYINIKWIQNVVYLYKYVNTQGFLLKVWEFVERYFQQCIYQVFVSHSEYKR